MPRYLYHCNECDEEYQELHSIKEKLTDCKFCNSKDSLIRVPSIFMTAYKDKKTEHRPGDIVKEFIEESQEDLKKQRKELEQKR